MKKVISICVCMCILCGCGNMRGIKRESAQNLHKLINEDNELYYNDREGHNDNVKMIKIDDTHAQIKIPVRYTEEIEEMEHLRKCPMTQEELAALDSKGKCNNCTLSQDYLTIDLEYYDTGNTAGTITLGLVFLPFTLYWALNCWGMKECDNRSISFNKIVLNEPPTLVEVLEPVGISNLQKKGIILSPAFTVQPKQMAVHCNKKHCVVVDENEKIVNEILVHKKIIPNKTKTKELIAEQERKDKERQKYLESIRKEQDKICPKVYENLDFSIGDVNTVRAHSLRHKFQCDDWMYQKMKEEDKRHAEAHPNVTRENQNRICPQVFNAQQLLPSTNLAHNQKVANLWQEYQCQEWQIRYMNGEDMNY